MKLNSGSGPTPISQPTPTTLTPSASVMRPAKAMLAKRFVICSEGGYQPLTDAAGTAGDRRQSFQSLARFFLRHKFVDLNCALALNSNRFEIFRARSRYSDLCRSRSP